MKSDTKNVKIGVCNVKFGEVDLGYTKGGVEVTVTTETHEVTVDQFGQTPINENIMGRAVSVKVPMAETTTENLLVVMPGAEMKTDSVDPTKKVVIIPTGVGVNLLETAKKLVLHPISAGDSKAEDFVIYKAATPGGMTFSYKVDDERIFDVEFKGYPDSANDNRLFAFGDDSVVESGEAK